jgi:DNA repair exonuclease SbcCD ATPase subunit
MTSLPEEIEGLRRAIGRVKEEWDSDLEQLLSQAGLLRNVIAQHERTTEKLKTEFRVLENAFQLISQICRVNMNELESELKTTDQQLNEKSTSASEPLAGENQTMKATEDQPQSE